MQKRSICGLADSAFWGSVTVWLALSPAALGAAATNFGPYNATFLDGGVGLTRPLSEQAAPLAANAPWSMSGWLRIAHDQSGEAIVSAVGDVAGGEWWGLALADGSLCLVVGSTTLRAGAALEAGRWYAVAAVFDGAAAHLYLEGREVAVQPLSTPRVPPSLELAPTAASPKVRAHFGGSLAQWTLMSTPLGAAAVQSLAQAPPNFSLVTFDAVGVGWPWQEHAWRGLQNPQDAWTLPRAKSPPGAPVAEPVPASKGLEPRGPERWALGSWRMSPAPALESGRAAGLGLGGALSQPRYDDSRWYAAVVPGTVLTTLIARGVYPDPNYGLNNLAIPDSLSRQDYWYRSVFDVPAGLQGRDFTLTFKGINYAAQVWLNGVCLGDIKGAFIRGVFNVTGQLRAGGSNVLAVRVSPPPHPGIPHEQSIAAGPGKTAAVSRSTVRPSSPPRAGIGFREFATATRVFGRTSNSLRRASCGFWTRTW